MYKKYAHWLCAYINSFIVRDQLINSDLTPIKVSIRQKQSAQVLFVLTRRVGQQQA